MTTSACDVCPERIDLATRHVAVTRSVESARRATVTVHEEEVLARMHLDCADRLTGAAGRALLAVALAAALAARTPQPTDQEN